MRFCKKIFPTIIVLLAVGMAVLVSLSTPLPQEDTVVLILFCASRFVEIMIPVLGIGALIKYLFSCSPSVVCRQCQDKEKQVKSVTPPFPLPPTAL